MKKIKSSYQILTLIVAPTMIFAACTKKLDYKAEYKDQVLEKSLISSEPYLYTASQGNSSRTDSGIRPYWKGEEKVVTFQFNEKSLNIIQVEQDSRYQANKSNSKILISVPIEHIEYRCAQDKYGQCTNKEEKNTETTWAQRSKFKPDFAGSKFSEANMLPAEMDKIFGGECYTETGSQILDAKIEADAINLRIEKTYRVNMSCVSNATSLGELLSNMTSTAVYHYSFTKLSKITSKDYVPVPYSQEDSNTFGFFATDVNKLDVDGNSIVTSKSELMNRWNPNRSELVYYLSDEFNKPENASIKEATLESFKRINRGLETAGVNFRVVGKDAEGRLPGDNRNSFIVLVEDPLAASILGYGPTTANPLTGEIVSGRVVMYSGVMKQYVRWTYEEIRRRQKQTKSDVQKVPAQKEVPQNVQPANKMKIEKLSAKMNILDQKQFDLEKFKKTSSITQDSTLNLVELEKIIKSGHVLSDKTMSPENTLNIMSKYCTYPAELFNFDEAVTTTLIDKMGSDLKPWMELSDGEKQKIIEIVLPNVWIPTLVHEMGHNLGLRHNFKGSEDKDNFYTTEELKEMKIDRPIPYSSVMDYPYTDLNHLPTLGKYDIAALRFGYKNEVEKNKDYMYCTDENVEVNVGCKRFDEGTTYTEMAQHEIKAYLIAQENRNNRNGRGNMSMTEDHLYASRVWNTFSNLRLYLTIMARSKYDRGLAYNSPYYQTIGYLKDLRSATVLSMNFLAGILSIPDKNCVIKNKKQNEIKNLPLTAIAAGATSCKDIPFNENIELIGEFGTFLNHVKDSKMKNPYVDQIDIRGIWIDKLLATKALFARNSGNRLNESSDNFLDLPEGRKLLPAVLASFAIGVNTTEMSFPINGELTKVPVVLNFADEMLVHKTLSTPLKMALALPDRDFYVAEWIVNYAKSVLRQTNEMNFMGESLADYITAMKYQTVQPVKISEETTKVYNNGNDIYLASTENNIIAAMAIENLITFDIVNNSEVRKEHLDAIVKAKIEDKEIDTKDFNAAEKAVAALPKEVLLASVNKQVPSYGYLIRLLNVMAK